MKNKLILILLLAYSFEAFSQDSTSTLVFDQLEESLEETEQEDAEVAEQLIQFLQDLENNPIDINTAGISDLLQIPGITIKTANSIINYRSEYTFKTIEDILFVPGIGKVTLIKIKPYITVGKGAYSIQNWFDNSKTEFISRYQQTLEDQRGYLIPDSSGGFLGNSVKYYQRFKLQTNNLSLNVTQEKDAGERLNALQGFDFNSMHLAYSGKGLIRRVVLGDYNLSFGQGLVIWSAAAFGKGREVIQSVDRNDRGLRPYGSAQESNYFRGTAVTIGKQNEWTFFYSNAPRTASVVGIDSVRFPSSSGFHRTVNEINRRNNINQQTIGGRFRAFTPFGNFGLTAYSSSFSKDVIRSTSIFDRYDFSGKSNAVIGIDYRAIISQSIVFGELARSDNDAYSGILGIRSRVGESTELALLYRNYARNFISILANGFSERSGIPQNERGAYFGVKHRISMFTVSGYFDQYYFDAPQNRNLSSSSGKDLLAMIEIDYSRTLKGYFLIRNEIKDDVIEAVTTNGRIEQKLGWNSRTSFRFHFEYQASPKLRNRSRIEWVHFSENRIKPENGFMIYHDIRMLISRKVTLDARWSIFETDSFDARIYQFENDLRYILSNVALNNSGQRWYAVLKYKFQQYVEVSAKISQTIIEDVHVLSSGLNQIDGNTRTFIGIQLRINT